MNKKSKKKSARKRKAGLHGFAECWSRFLPERSNRGANIQELLSINGISFSAPAQTTYLEQIRMIAAHATNPIPIEHLHPELGKAKHSRGCVYFNQSLGNEIDKIALNFRNMYWWLSDKGLNIDIARPDLGIGAFDKIAGALCCKYAKTGRLSKDQVAEIAAQLDRQISEKEFLNCLERSQRDKFAHHNQNNPKDAIKTFAKAIAVRKFAYLARKRLYRARERYRLAESRLPLML